MPGRARGSRTRPSAAGSISERALGFVRALPDHPLLDRIVRGRTWIALLGLMLAGVVAMQVEQLKLGASIGRSIERSSQLQSRNELLQASVASLSDEQRIEAQAAKEGMIMPPPNAIAFLPSSHQGNVVGKALANIHSPNSVAFSSLLTGSGAVVISPDIAATAPPTGSLVSNSGSVPSTPTQASPSAVTSPTTQTAATAATATAQTAATATAQTPATATTTPYTATTAQAPATATTTQPGTSTGTVAPASGLAASGAGTTTQSAAPSGGVVSSGG